MISNTHYVNSRSG